jgi:hypothetical protein
MQSGIGDYMIDFNVKIVSGIYRLRADGKGTCPDTPVIGGKHRGIILVGVGSRQG